jgi:23S rRNA (pseudouridine1915-N3)-methyltransferase
MVRGTARPEGSLLDPPPCSRRVKIRVLAVGKLKEKYTRDAVADYLTRVNRYVPCEVIEVKDGSSEGDETRIVALEGQRLRDTASRENEFRVALDARGKSYSSPELARLLGDHMTYGRDLAFLIGGPFGLEPGLRRESDLQLSLSSLTFPHDLVRVLLLEQIYRAFTILRGEPYHK